MRAVARKNCATVDSKRLGVDLGNDASGFAHHQRSGGDVPSTQIEFPEAVETSGGHCGQIERRRPVAPHRLRLARHDAKVFTVAGEVCGMESGAHERIAQPLHCRNLQRLAVERRSRALLRNEEFIVEWGIDHARAELVHPLVRD